MASENDLESAAPGSAVWKARALMVGAVLGALFGLGAAYLYVRQIEDTGAEPTVSPKEAVTVGVTVVGLLRQIANLGE